MQVSRDRKLYIVLLQAVLPQLIKWKLSSDKWRPLKSKSPGFLLSQLCLVVFLCSGPQDLFFLPVISYYYIIYFKINLKCIIS